MPSNHHLHTYISDYSKPCPVTPSQKDKQKLLFCDSFSEFYSAVDESATIVMHRGCLTGIIHSC